MTNLTTGGLTVVRQGRRILADVSLEATDSEFVAVIGPNGAGKSTLLSMLAGLLTPSDGLITLDGMPLQHIEGKVLARRRAYLPQSPRCEWPISVERLVALGLTPVLPAFGGLPKAFLPRIDAALALCDLLRQRLQSSTTLSGGELARAMLARAMVSDPDILIVDEPTTGLDPRHALEAAARLRALAQAGKLVIAAIHDLTLVARYSTRIIALKAGQLIAEGPTETTLTSDLVQRVFDVDACVSKTPGGALVDYLPVAAQSTSP